MVVQDRKSDCKLKQWKVTSVINEENNDCSVTFEIFFKTLEIFLLSVINA